MTRRPPAGHGGGATTADVVVVGSGITGAATAAAIAARGASVIVLDKEDGAAREGSGRAQGSLRVQGRHAAELPLAMEALAMWREAAEGEDIELVVGGNLYIATREAELPVLRGLVDGAHRSGLASVELLDPAQVRDLIPAATGPFLGAMWSPVDAQCQPDKGTRLFARRARAAGAELRYATRVTRLLVTGERITGVDTVAGRITAGAVVVAAGIWTPHLAASAGVDVPVMPVCMTELETRPVEPLFAATLRAFGFGARQRPGGGVVVSGGLNAVVTHAISLSDMHGLRWWIPRALAFRSQLRVRIDARRIAQQVRVRAIRDPRLIPARSPEPRADRRSVDRALARLALVIPRLASATPARYWGGMVDLTPDGLPVVDGRTGPGGLTIIAGLSGHGLALGPVLGAIGAELALDGRSTRPIDAFSLARFRAGRVDPPELMI